MLSRTPIRSFFAQHNIPVVPQGAICPPFSSPTTTISVGYLLTRQPTVQHSLHPLEIEFGFVLDREYSRYPRHPNTPSAVDFFKERALSIDSWNRQDSGQIQRDFFNLESHRDATRQTLERFEPAKRLTKADFFDPCDEEVLAKGPPARQSLQRRLDDYLYLIVKQKGADGKWTVPSRERTDATHSLRTAVEATLLQDHSRGVDAYFFSNAPQGVLQWKNSTEPLPRGASKTEANKQLFVFTASYLSGRPKFDLVVPEVEDHAWVTRHELSDYQFEHPDMFSLLRDITTDTRLRN